MIEDYKRACSLPYGVTKSCIVVHAVRGEYKIKLTRIGGHPGELRPIYQLGR